MAREISPEEKLLRLIRQAPKKDEPAKEKQDQRQISQPNMQAPSVGAVIKEKSKKKTNTNISFQKNSLDPFKITVMALSIFFILGIIYFSYELFGKKQEPVITDIEKLLPKQEQAEQITENKKAEAPLKEEQQQAGEEEQVAPKNLFGTSVTRETDTQTATEGPSVAEMAKSLNLVGVITGSNPQAIIEDKSSNQTYYVTENEAVLQFKVQKIEKAQMPKT